MGTRPEIIAQCKAEIDRAPSAVTLAEQTYNRTKQLAARQFAPQSKLDEDTNVVTLAQRRLDQAKLADDEAVRGFTAEEHQIAEANVDKAAAKLETIKALVDQLTVVILWVVKLKSSLVFMLDETPSSTLHPDVVAKVAG